MRSRFPQKAISHGVGENIWPVFTDIFIGFLALILISSVFVYRELATTLAEQRKGTETPPIEKQEFKERFLEQFPAELVHPPQITREEFSALNLRFPEALLFPVCGVHLSPEGQRALDALEAILEDFQSSIDRIEVTGHTDKDHPSETGLCAQQGIATNWELSAMRAIAVVERLAPEDRSGLDPAKFWAAGLSSYEPVDPTADQDDVDVKRINRRIEILIKFKEVANKTREGASGDYLE